MFVPVTTLYAGIFGIMLIALSINTIRMRVSAKISLGDHGDVDMTRRMRVMANFCEYVPLFVIILALIEISGAPRSALHVFGIVFLAGRVLHYLGLSKTMDESKGR